MTHIHNCCPLCGKQNIGDKYLSSQLPIRQCVCGAVFLSSFPSKEELKKIYDKTYFENCGFETGNENELRKMKQLTFSARIREINKLMKRGKILDVGCATGYFLEIADDAGWDIHGVELSEYASKLARQKFGDKIFNGTIEEARYSDETFDLITLFDLLEHIQDTGSFMQEIIRILKPSGLLMIETPNVASFSCRFMGEKWIHYKADHLHYFSPVTIKDLLMKSGFTPIRIGISSKFINPAYVIDRFTLYNLRIISPLLIKMDRYIPHFIKKINFPVYCGKMLVLAKKKEANE